MPTVHERSVRERLSDALLHAAIDMAADRERMSRALHAAHRHQFGFDQAIGSLMLAGWVDSLLLWLSMRLRPSSSFDRLPASDQN